MFILATLQPPHLLRAHEHLKVGPAEPAIPVICDVSSIHDLTEQVAQICPGNLVLERFE